MYFTILGLLKTAFLESLFALAGVIVTLLFIFAFRRRWLALFLTIILFVFGCEVYSNKSLLKPTPEIENNGVAKYLAIADNSLSSFFMSRGSYDEFNKDKGEATQANRNETNHLTAYYIFHALCYAYGAAFLCFIFGRRISNALAIWFRSYLNRIVTFIPVLRKGDVVVFWNVDQESLEAADFMINSPKKMDRRYPVFVFRETKPFSLRREATSTEALLNDRHYSWIYVDPDSLQGLLTCAIYNAKEHYFLSPDGQANVATANQVVNRLVANGKKARIYVRIDAEADEDVLFDWARRKQADLGSRGEIILINEPSQVASSLSKSYPLLEAPGIEIDTNSCTVKGDFKILLVGHGAQGKALLREMVQCAVFPGSDTSLSITVVDGKEEAFEPLKSFLEQSDSLIDNSNREDPTFPAQIQFTLFDVHSGEFRKWIHESVETSAAVKSMPWNRAIFALPNDLENLRLAQSLEREYRNSGIFDFMPCKPSKPMFFAGVRRRGNAKYSESITGGNASDAVFVATFGNIQNLYSRLRNNMEEADRAAKFVEYYWKGGGKKSLCDYRADKDRDIPWLKAPFSYKESDRSFARGTRTLVALLGNSSCLRALAYVEKNKPDVLKRLAKTEHLRWNAFLLMRCVKPWKPTPKELEDLKENMGRRVKIRPNDQDEGNRHAAIVPYEQLAKVAELFQNAGFFTDIDETDERFVRSLPDVLEITGMKSAL